MQQLYKGYKFNIVVIATGKESQKALPTKEDVDILLRRLQKAAVLGTINICKTAMSM